MRSHRFLMLACALVVSAMVLSARQQPDESDSELNLGIEAYKHARNEEARQHFERAVVRDPTDAKAHLYLGTTYAQEFIPGADSPENNVFGQRAIEQYKIVLELDAANVSAAKGIAYLFLQMKKFDSAEEYYRKAIEIDPKDPENYYLIAVLDWTLSYQLRMELKAKLNLKPEQPLIRRAECWTVQDANKERVASGIVGRCDACRQEAEREGTAGTGVDMDSEDQHAIVIRLREVDVTGSYGIQSAMKTFVSCGTLALRPEIHTSFFPSGLNIGKPSKPSV